jgi:hypothetical protein
LELVERRELGKERRTKRGTCVREGIGRWWAQQLSIFLDNKMDTCRATKAEDWMHSIPEENQHSLSLSLLFKSLLSKKEELVLFSPVRGFVLHIFI